MGRGRHGVPRPADHCDPGQTLYVFMEWVNVSGLESDVAAPAWPPSTSSVPVVPPTPTAVGVVTPVPVVPVVPAVTRAPSGPDRQRW